MPRTPPNPWARTRRGHALVTAVLAAVLAGCAPGAESIPPGAQVVHVVITDDAVTLDPPAVRAGDVYLVLDQAVHDALVVVSARPTADASEGPLTQADVERIGRGDTQGTSVSGLDAGGCSPEQNASARGLLGHCGNVMRLAVRPGLYVIAGEPPETVASGTTATMGVLEVTP